MNNDDSSTDSETYSNHQGATQAAQRLFKHNDEVSIEDIKDFDWSRFDVDEAIAEAENPHREPVILAYLYWIEDLTQREIGQKLGYSHAYISQNMADVPTGPDPSKYRASVSHYFNEGREKVYTYYQGEQYFAYVHRLTKVAHCGIEAFYDDGDGDDEGTEMVVHHQNAHSLDNRPENLEVMEKEEHDDLHTSDDSEFIIEGGEAKLVENPDADAQRADDEWLNGDLDALDENDIPDADEVESECLKQAIERYEANELSVEDAEADVEADVGRQGA